MIEGFVFCLITVSIFFIVYFTIRFNHLNIQAIILIIIAMLFIVFARIFNIVEIYVLMISMLFSIYASIKVRCALEPENKKDIYNRSYIIILLFVIFSLFQKSSEPLLLLQVTYLGQAWYSAILKKRWWVMNSMLCFLTGFSFYYINLQIELLDTNLIINWIPMTLGVVLLIIDIITRKK